MFRIHSMYPHSASSQSNPQRLLYLFAAHSWQTSESCLCGPAVQYASFSGIVGLVVYAIASGIPILIIAAFGGRVHKDMPHVGAPTSKHPLKHSTHTAAGTASLFHARVLGRLCANSSVCLLMHDPVAQVGSVLAVQIQQQSRPNSPCFVCKLLSTLCNNTDQNTYSTTHCT